MVSRILANDQIVREIIFWIAVDVVDFSLWRQGMAQSFLSNQHMFVGALAINPYLNVQFRIIRNINASSERVVTFTYHVNHLAFAAAKPPGLPSAVAEPFPVWALENSPTILALKSVHGIKDTSCRSLN